MPKRGKDKKKKKKPKALASIEFRRQHKLVGRQARPKCTQGSLLLV
jgi:hypothetical protein